ncbi:HCP-like protein [Eremomyces bilateralis CBS 781.70]|uniref:HCP-like protein n=1 Tax=Eremomyces bilateralis CBS 781.70 TaxID=1392243 RepID=A0A6G1FRU9_9PEZI|nr:HCP-like protein [Eremomyces bilateralis CBS 781.70]KAF1808458.1 HCP-like protein [Eremomyces bilateralis CBS 781.70]
MPEVPENIQENLAHLELEAIPPRNAGNQVDSPSSNYSQASPANNPQGQDMDYVSRAYHQAPTVSHPMDNGPPHEQQNNHDYHTLTLPPDLPNFSPFPKLVNPAANVPPSDDQKEAILENARIPVLNSNDPEMQLVWAQDCLIFVDAAQSHEERLSMNQPARPATPQVEHQLRVDAMEIVQFLANQHHPKAEFMRGMWLEFGKFEQRVDKREAFRSYSRAAEKGYSRAEYRIGMQYESSNDPVKALIHYKRGAEAGDSASNYRLGMMTLLGQAGQHQDFAKGINLLRQAASTADENAPQGAFVLGMLQARELPQIAVPEIYLPHDDRLARQNIEKAAYLGFAKAQVKMGAAYELCLLGCEFSPALSLHYNALAARQGEPEAEMAISKWFLCGYEGVFAKNEELAFQYAQRAAQAQLSTAEFAMGYFHEIGMQTPVSIDKALEWYEKAAQNDNQDAVSRIESIKKSQTLSKKDHEQVAISRIKSQYGSKRGARPDRFKAQAPPLPTVLDDDGPEADQPPQPPSQSQTQPNVVRPPRTSSYMPYPDNDGPPKLNIPERPATAAPYPVDDAPPHQGGQLGGAYFVPEIRAQSAAPPDLRPLSGGAFGINPNVYGNGRPNTGAGAGAPSRPYSSVADYSGGSGGRPRPPPGSRISSGPPGPGNYGRQPSPHERPYDGRQASPHQRPYDDRPPPEHGRPVHNPNLAPHPDIGYAAPPGDGRGRPAADNSMPQRRPDNLGFVAPLEVRKKPTPSPHQPSHNPNVPPKDHRPHPTGPGAQPQYQSYQHGNQHHPQQSPHPPQGMQGQGAGARPPRTASLSQNAPSQHGPSQHVPPRKNTPSKEKPSGPQPPSGAMNPPKRPGKGPKTFEEMKIPQGKKDGDCVSFPLKPFVCIFLSFSEVSALTLAKQTVM